MSPLSKICPNIKNLPLQLLEIILQSILWTSKLWTKIKVCTLFLDSYPNHNSHNISNHIHNTSNHNRNCSILHYHSNNIQFRKTFTYNHHNNRRSQSHTCSFSNNNNGFLNDEVSINLGYYKYVNDSIFFHIGNKIDIHIGTSCEYNLKIFISHFCTCYIDDNVKFLEKITVAYYHNLLHDEVGDILDNKPFCRHCKLDQDSHQFQSILSIFLRDTFFYLDVL